MKLTLQKSTQKRKAFAFMHLFAGTSLLFLSRHLYFHYPFYQTFISLQTKEIISFLFVIMLVVLWVDTVLKYLFKSKLEETKLTLLFIFGYSLLLKLLSKLKSSKREINIKWNYEIKTAVLSTIVKFFYIPIMLNFATAGATAIWADLKAFDTNLLELNFNNLYSIAVAGIFLVDTSIFAFAYAFESKWLRSEIRSVEPTVLGWVAALATYPPFNALTGQIFPLAKSGDILIFASQPIIFTRSVQILILLCHLVFVSASIALGTKASNLTNRGIVSKGPYKYVRHPAYTAKLLAWLLTGLLYGINLDYYIFLIPYIFIYGLRAWTEEKHLSMDPDYVKYKQQVKYRVFPKIF